MCFWVLLPLTMTFYDWAGQADDFFGMNSHSKSYVHILFQNFQSLFVRPDMGSDLLSLSNILGILYNVFSGVIYPVAVFYLFYGYYSPKSLTNRGYRKYLIPGLFILIVPWGVTTLLSTFVFSVNLGYYSFLSLTYVFTLFFSISGFFFFLLGNWVETQQLARENLQSELALLKNQINPHFLFNTLNNIDSLIKSNTEKASHTLVKLSEILRYMIYETNVTQVQLSDEIRHIESYIELQKLQYVNRELVRFNIMGSPANIQVAPMLFIPFVENAFKHCTDKSVPGAVKIAFNIDGKQIRFESENVSDPEKRINKDEASGVGLNIIRRRLELIYSGRHTLDINENNSTFRVTLTVNTHEN